MGFTWVNFYPSFIKEILEASDLDKGQIEQMDYAIKYDDTCITMTIQLTMIISIMLLKELILYYQEQMESLF